MASMRTLLVWLSITLINLAAAIPATIVATSTTAHLTTEDLISTGSASMDYHYTKTDPVKPTNTNLIPRAVVTDMAPTTVATQMDPTHWYQTTKAGVTTWLPFVQTFASVVDQLPAPLSGTIATAAAATTSVSGHKAKAGLAPGSPVESAAGGGGWHDDQGLLPKVLANLGAMLVFHVGWVHVRAWN